MNADKRWRKKQEYAAPGRYYGGDGTIWGTDYLDVEVHNGHVVAVTFRCQPLPYVQTDVDTSRAAELKDQPTPRLTGVEVLDQVDPNE